MKLTLQLVVDVVNTQFTIIICSAVVVFNTLIFCLLISSNSFKKLLVGKQIKVSLSEMRPGNTKYVHVKVNETYSAVSCCCCP